MGVFDGNTQEELQASFAENPEAKAQFDAALQAYADSNPDQWAAAQGGQLVTAGGSNTGVAQGTPIYNHNTGQMDIVGGNQGGLDPASYMQTQESVNVATGERTITERPYSANQGMGSLTEQQQHDLYYGNTPLSGQALLAQQAQASAPAPTGMLEGGVLGNSTTNPYLGAGVTGTYVNSKGKTVARMEDGSQKVILEANGMLNSEWGKAPEHESIYKDGATYDTGMQDSTRNKRIGGKNEEIGVFNRPDVEGTEFEDAYLPGRPQGKGTAGDLRRYHEYYSENPELRAALSPDEQVELLWLDKETGALDESKGSYKEQQYGLRDSFGIPRKTGFKGMDSGWEWDYDLQTRGKDPYQILAVKGGNIGGYVDKDRPGGSVFQEATGEIMKGLQYFVDKSAGAIGIKGVKAEDVISVVSAALTFGGSSALTAGGTQALGTTAATEFTKEMGKEALKDILIKKATKEAVNAAIETGVDWNNPDDVKQVVDNIEVDVSKKEEAVTDGETGPMIGDTPVNSREGWHWERDGDSWKAVPDDPEDPNENGGGGGDEGGSQIPAPEGFPIGAPQPGDNIPINSGKQPDSDWVYEHVNPDGTTVRVGADGDVWEVDDKDVDPGSEEPTDINVTPWWLQDSTLAAGGALLGNVIGGITDGSSTSTNTGSTPNGSGNPDADTTGDGPSEGPGTGPDTGPGSGPNGEATGTELQATAKGLLGTGAAYKDFMHRLELDFPMLKKQNIKPIDYLKMLSRGMKG